MRTKKYLQEIRDDLLKDSHKENISDHDKAIYANGVLDVYNELVKQ